MIQKELPIILFDGICNLCNASIQFIIKYEKEPSYQFCTLQSETAQKILSNFKNEKIFDSVILIENGKLYQESKAALRIAKKLKYFWILYYLIFFPSIIRDPIYRWIANNRYSWFGKKNQCMVPNENLKSRFL